MIILPHTQGTLAWQQSRLGIPTASNFHRIVTAKTMKLSDQSREYIWQLVAELILGESVDESLDDGFMARGVGLELEAVKWYEFDQDCETTEVGLCLTDDRMVGCSPDRLVGADGGLEIKCPSAKNHVGFLLGEAMDKYRAQVQGQLWVSKRDWWDLVSYNPYMEKVRLRMHPDPDFQKALNVAMPAFLEQLEAAKVKIQALGCELQYPAERVAA